MRYNEIILSYSFKVYVQDEKIAIISRHFASAYDLMYSD